MKQLLINNIQTLAAAQGIWQSNRAELPASFQITLAKAANDYAFFCGLNSFCEKVANGISSDELTLLATLTNNNGQPLFDHKFLNYLDKLQFIYSLESLREGALVFIDEPVISISGPLLQCHLFANLLLKIINSESAVTTNASNFYRLINNESLIYNNSNDSLSLARAASIVGMNRTTNILAHDTFNIPLCNIMSENWVTSFANETDAFRHMANSMPNETILAIDTFNPLSGCENAIAIGKELRRRKHDLFAVQLKQNNLKKYAKRIRKQLDLAGFINTKIIADGVSSINDIQTNRNSPVDGWIISEGLIKNFQTVAFSCRIISLNNIDDIVPNQNKWQIRRLFKDSLPTMDIIFDNPLTLSKFKKISKYTAKDLIQPIYEDGNLVYTAPSLSETIAYTKAEIEYVKKININKYKLHFQII